MLLKNAVVYGDDFVPRQGDVAVEGSRIRATGDTVNSLGKERVVDLSGLTLLPGFIDIHIHGCAGADTCDGTPETLETISACLARRGVTSFCPTSMTLPYEQLENIFHNIRDCRGRLSGAYIQGINMEGPYIAAKKKGAQNGAFVRPPDIEEFRRLYSAADGGIRLVDIALRNPALWILYGKFSPFARYPSPTPTRIMIRYAWPLPRVPVTPPICSTL